MSQKALKKSIEHWKRLVACETWKEAKAESLGSASCALCEEYCIEAENECERCPVRDVSGSSYCRGTPYSKASREFDRWYYGLPHTFHEAAKEELLFQQSLVEA